MYAPAKDLEPDRISQMTQAAPGEETVLKEGELYAKVKVPGSMGSKRKWVARHHVLTEQGMGCVNVCCGVRAEGVLYWKLGTAVFVRVCMYVCIARGGDGSQRGRAVRKVMVPGSMGSKRKWVARHHVLTEQGVWCSVCCGEGHVLWIRVQRGLVFET